MNVMAGQGESDGDGAPHSPANTAPVDDHAGQEIDIAYVGSAHARAQNWMTFAWRRWCFGGGVLLRM